MYKNQLLNLSFALASTCLAVGCAKVEDQKQIATAALDDWMKTTPAQKEAVKTAYQDYVKRSKETDQKQLKDRKRESLDGQGRIFHDKANHQVNIHRNSPEPIGIQESINDKEADQKVMGIKNDLSRSKGKGPHNITPTEVEEAIKQRFARMGAVRFELEQDPYYVVIKLESGRACLLESENSKKSDDCFFCKQRQPQDAIGSGYCTGI